MGSSTSKILLVPQSIRAIGFVSPDSKLQLLTLPPFSLGPRDILVQIEAVGINPADNKVPKFTATPQTPLVLGYDASGKVVQIGSSVSLFKVGDDVFYSGDLKRFGSNSTHQVVDERIVGRKPNSLTHMQSAAIPLVALTAYEGLEEVLGIKDDKKQNKGKTILIVGGAGGVGSIAIQLSKQVFGLTVIATASRLESEKYCQKMGADHIINHSKPLAEQLKDLGIDSLDYIFNTGDMTPEYFNQFAALIKPFGHIVGINGFENSFSLAPLFMKRAQLSMECMLARSFFGIETERQGIILSKVSSLYNKGILISTAESHQKFSLEALLGSHEQMKTMKTIGKVVLSNVQEYFKSA